VGYYPFVVFFFLLSRCFQFLLGAEEGDLPTTYYSLWPQIFYMSALPFKFFFSCVNMHV